MLRKLRRRSLARLRQEIEPVSHDAVARFLPAWQRVGGSLRGVDGVVAAIDQLAGCPVPASALEPLVLAARVRDYEPSMLDELTASGEVIWAGHAPLPGSDGWVSLHLADQAHLTLPEVEGDEPDGLQRAVLDALDPGGAWFFRQLADRVGSTSDADLSSALWELTWKGRVTNDTLAPLRALVRSGTPSHRTRRTPPRLGRTTGGRMPVRTGPPETAGRWALLPDRDGDPTRRAHARAEHLLERHGVVTRGAVVSERVAGGFAGVYKVLSAFEDTGRCRRGYFIEGLGAAQFGSAGAIDRLRTFAEPDSVRSGTKPSVVALAATDPANAFGAALPWPDAGDPERTGHRPGRKAGALVVLVDGGAHRLRRARRPHAPHLERRPRRAHAGDGGAGRCRPPGRARPAHRREGRRPGADRQRRRDAHPARAHGGGLPRDTRRG